MRHLTMKDYHVLFDAQDAPYPPELQEHLETCEPCAAIHNIVLSSVRAGEPADDIGEPCAFCDDVYEIFRNRLSLERFIPLMSHLLRCEECGDFFEMLRRREAPSSQALLAEEWLEAAGRALDAAKCSREDIAVRRVSNIYAHAASGEDLVIEVTGSLKNGAAFTLKYDPNGTVFRVATASIAQIRLRRFVDNRWIEGWTETEGRQSGCTIHPNSVAILQLIEPDGTSAATLETVPYSRLKKTSGEVHAHR